MIRHGNRLRHVYFPTDSIVSLLYVLADGASAEISVVGKDGLIGIALSMGGETTPSRAIAQTAVCNRHHSVEQHLSRWLLLLEYHRGWITVHKNWQLLAAAA